MEKGTIALGADHAGFDYKETVKTHLESLGYEVLDFGTHSNDSVDYPDFVHPCASAVESKKADLGFLFCGSANGVAMTANKHQDVRAAIAWQREIASLARQHNNANVLAIPCRFIAESLALDLVNAFLQTDFEGGRHQRRVDKIAFC